MSESEVSGVRVFTGQANFFQPYERADEEVNRKIEEWLGGNPGVRIVDQSVSANKQGTNFLVTVSIQWERSGGTP